jgi:hypothetical protein
MRTSDAILSCCLVALAFGAGEVRAFEIKDRPLSLAPPAQALPVISHEQRAAPVLPGGETSVREALRGFFHHYKSGDKTAAMKQLEFAAAKGDVAAQWKLARLYADGDGVKPNDMKAFQLFSGIANARADESRDSPNAGVVAKSFVALGTYWLEGIPNSAIVANPARAMEMFQYAASYFGDPDAQYQLARMHLNGLVGQVDPMRAARWLNLAAEKGHVYARAVLGQLLFNGDAMPRQAPRGLAWLSLAREQADPAKDAWIVELHDKALTRANDDERRLARTYQNRLARQAERR